MQLCLFSSALPGWDPPRVARAAHEAGLSAVEWGIGPGQVLESPRAARAMLRALDVEAAGICIQGGAASLTTPARIEPFAALAAELGAPHVRVFAPPLRANVHRRALEGIACASVIAQQHGVAVLVETSPGTIAPSTLQVRALVEGFPAEHLGVLYDPGNMVIEGHVDPRLGVEELGPYLRHVHVKNVLWRRIGTAWTWRHARLDAGLADWPAILGALRQAGYGGRLSLDHLGGNPTLALLRREVELLRSWLRAR